MGLGKGTELKVATVGWQEGCVSGGHPGDKAVVDKSYGSGPGFMDHVTPLWGPQKPSGRGWVLLHAGEVLPGLLLYGY